MRNANRVRNPGRAGIVAVAVVFLGGCEAGAVNRDSGVQAAAEPRTDPVTPCALVTAADIERISAYAGAVRREVSSDSVCWWTVGGQQFGVSVSVGRYVPTPFLGGTDVDLGGGFRARRSDAGWLNQIILPDDTAITLILDGTAVRPGAAKGEYRLALGDGRDVDLVEQYEAYARRVAERLR